MSATLEGHRISNGRVLLPKVGIWRADVVLDTPEALTGAVTLVLGGLTLKGFIVFGDAYQGASRYRVVGGAGGWRKTLQSKGYRNAAGLQLSLVVGDAAKEAGESVVFEAGADVSIGPGYTRPLGPAARTLELLTPSWWIAPDGVTHIGLRPTGAITTVFDLVEYRPDDRVAVVASETPEVFENGKTVSLTGAPTMVVGDIVHRIDAAELRTELWADTGADRLLGYLRAIVRELMADTKYYGLYEYYVITATDDLADLQPARDKGLPPLSGVPMRTGLGGAKAKVDGGMSVLVAFVDGDPSRPVVVAYSSPGDGVFSSALVTLASTDETDPTAKLLPAKRVLRYGDTVSTPTGDLVLEPGAVPMPVSRVKA